MIKRLEIQDDGIIKLFSFDPKNGNLTCEILDKNIIKIQNVKSYLNDNKMLAQEDSFIFNPPIKGSYSVPLKIYIDITDACQLNCKHCLTKKLNKGNELNISTLKSIADECNKLGVFYVKFGGGEPLLHKDFFAAVQYFRSKGVFLSLSTNGYLINPQTAVFLKNNQVKTTVSVEGPKQLDEYIRGSGHYDVAISALQCLKKYDVDVSLRVTLTRYMLNRSYIDSLLNVASDFNVPLKFSYCRPAGSAIDNDCLIRYEDKDLYHNIIQYLNQKKEDHKISLDEGMMYYQPNRLDWYLYKNRICGSANRTMHINSKGQISPCVFMGPEFIEKNSNYKYGDINLYWSEKEGITFKKIRDIDMPRDCLFCTRKCKYECLATRLNVSGCFQGKDPNCLKNL